MSDELCPHCWHKGRNIGAVTPRALLTETARARLGDRGTVRFCRNGACPVVYYDALATPFLTEDVRVPVFQKSTDPGRLVCYCFDHAVNAIEAEVRQTGGSVVPDAITEKCKQGLDRCEKTNPQGSCCLGNVRQVVKQAIAAQGAKASGDSDCGVPGVRAIAGLAHAEPAAGAAAAATDHSCCASPRSDD